jgi:hypothetical protein
MSISHSRPLEPVCGGIFKLISIFSMGWAGSVEGGLGRTRAEAQRRRGAEGGDREDRKWGGKVKGMQERHEETKVRRRG